jgi:hypothetical protein
MPKTTSGGEIDGWPRLPQLRKQATTDLDHMCCWRPTKTNERLCPDGRRQTTTNASRTKHAVEWILVDLHGLLTLGNFLE